MRGNLGPSEFRSDFVKQRRKLGVEGLCWLPSTRDLVRIRPGGGICEQRRYAVDGLTKGVMASYARRSHRRMASFPATRWASIALSYLGHA